MKRIKFPIVFSALLLLASVCLGQTIFPQPGQNIYLDGSHILVGSIPASVIGTNGPGTPGFVLTTDGVNLFWGSVTSAGGASLSGNNTFTGSNTFTQPVVISSLTNNAGTANTVAAYDSHTPPRLGSLANGGATTVLHGATPPSYSAVALGSDVSGILQAAQFPALSGDVTTIAGSLATTLATVGTAGTFRSITVNAKGLATAGSNPTTFSGYGISDSSANLFAALTDDNGSTWTNLTYRYETNAIPSTGTLVFGQSYQTNTAGANVTYGALTIGAAFYESCVVYYTNSAATDSTLTYNGVHGPFGAVPAVLVATNGHMTRVLLEHYGTYTNASKLDL